ncbi:MAG: hypothetical protein LC733_01370 [Actinobacteria bacterium]|nr:hypothetical protein [Actinomycetota bacterium]
MNDELVHQLVLLDDDDRQWRLDEPTRDVGRRGVALARAALRQAAPRAA